MANKKCPKCGEDNPAEAVMCWACYTPLTGAAPLNAGAATMPATAGAAKPIGASLDAGPDDKKNLDPKVIGVVAVLLLGAIAGGVMMFGGGGSTEPTGELVNTAGPALGADAVAPPPPPVATGPLVMPAVPNAQPVAAVPLPFTTVVNPNPNESTGTAGILATQPSITPRQAMGLAKAARNQFMSGGRWSNMQIAVFSDANSAKTFAAYQAGRKGAKLQAGDFQALADQGVWRGAAAFYETIGKREYPSYPSGQPTSWWGRGR